MCIRSIDVCNFLSGCMFTDYNNNSTVRWTTYVNNRNEYDFINRLINILIFQFYLKLWVSKYYYRISRIPGRTLTKNEL